MQLTRKRLAIVAAESLAEAIRRGEYPDFLPGSRVLAERLGVSRPVVGEACRFLQRKGWIENAGPRTVYRVVRQTSPRDNSPTEPKQMCFVLPARLEGLPFRDQLLIRRGEALMSRRGWKVMIVLLPFQEAKRPRSRWDRQLPSDPEIRMVIFYGNPAIARWAISRKRRFLFVGGTFGGLPVSMVGVKGRWMAEDCVKTLIALGHRRIVLPMCACPALLADGIREAIATEFAVVGAPYSERHNTPESGYDTPEVLRLMIEKSLATYRPTAFLALSWNHLLTILACVWKAGLKIPGDVSVALLSDDPVVEWFHPRIASFEFPLGRLLRHIRNWLENPPEEPQYNVYRARLKPFESIGSPPVKGPA